jgi:hypothetical protein
LSGRNPESIGTSRRLAPAVRPLPGHRDGWLYSPTRRRIEGFGANSRQHTSGILRLSQDLPVVIEVVDAAERIDEVLPMLDEMVRDGMVTVEKAHVIAYRGSPRA